MNAEQINRLCDTVRETGFAIHKYHRHGHLEKIYGNALANRLRKQGLKVEQQHPLKVYDEDRTILGEYFADLLVEGVLIVEIKAVRSVADEHVAKTSGICVRRGKRPGYWSTSERHDSSSRSSS